MNTEPVTDRWERGSPYERYIGRWSRRIAPLFLSWLDRPGGKRWLDVGCGTGALAATILEQCAPETVVGVEPSEGFLALAERTLGARARLLPGTASAIPLASDSCDVAVSGLVLNFVPDLSAALLEMQRVVTRGGVVAGYVWDYADGMEVIRHFWDAAAALDPAAERLHEGGRFPVCTPAGLRSAFEAVGLSDVDTAPLELTARFEDFDDYWSPFLGGQGPAPAYVASLAEDHRTALRARLQAMLAPGTAGALAMRARAWAVRGVMREDA